MNETCDVSVGYKNQALNAYNLNALIQALYQRVKCWVAIVIPAIDQLLTNHAR